MFKKRKVAFYLPTLNGGGAERVVVNVLNNLANEDNIEFLMVLNKKEGVFVNQLSSKIPIYELKTKRMRDSIPALLKFLKEEKPDLLISGMSHVNLITIIANRISKNKTKIIVTEHANLSSVNKKSKKNTLFNIIKLILMKKLYPKTERIISVSKGVQDDLRKYIKLDNEQMKVIYNPVISNTLYVKAAEQVNHSWYENKKNPIIIGIGRLTRQKDFENLIQAFSILKSRVDSRLIILGEGKDREKLEKLIKDLGLEEYVDLHGFEENPYKFLRNADMFVLSSKYEGLPTVLIEALALKCNIVSTDCPSGPNEILRDGEFGRLVPIENSELLAEAMINGIEKPLNINDNEELENWLNEFDSSQVANNYLNLIKEILQ
ncbi:glycosyltransferase [Bacillus fonticola]|uniref:glycosyltransferase n=1 Tax=Bacillus fonticola TaxID=2728853 RepID=UPI0014750C6A|nr:glycosyltransferase [Bacillus fonticola]